MPVLNIEGRRVRVDDSFLKLTPEQQNETVDEIARSLAVPKVTAQVEQPPLGKGIGQRVDDFVRGAADTLSFGLSDEISAALGAATGIGGTFGDYSGNLESQRQRDAEGGGARLAGQLAGGLTGGVGLAKSGLSATANAVERGVNLAGVAKAGAMEGIALGGAQGFGSGEGGFFNRLANSAAGATAGGLLGAAAPYAVAGGGAALRAATAPLTARLNPEAAAQRALVTAMERSGMSADDVAASLRAAQADGQDVFTVADALGNSGQRMLTGVVRTPNDFRQQAVEQLVSRQSGQGRRVSNALAEGFDAPMTASSAREAMTAARDQAADVGYSAVRSGARSVNVTPAIEAIDEVLQPGVMSLANPGTRIADDSVEGVLSRVRGMLTDGRSNISDFTAVLRVKQDIDDMIGRAVRAGSGNQARLLSIVKSRLDGELSAASPQYANARDAFRTGSRAIEAIETGAQAARSGRSEDIVATYRALSDAEKAGFRVGFANEYITKTQRSADGVNKARPLINDATRAEFPVIAAEGRGDQMMRRIGREQTMFDTYRQGLGGSATADNIADMADLQNFDPAVMSNLFRGDLKGAAISAAARALNEGKGLPPRVIERIGRSLMETDAANAEKLLTIARSTRMNDEQKRALATGLLNHIASTVPARATGPERRAPLEITVPVPVR